MIKIVNLKEITTKIGSGSTPTGGSEAYKSAGTSLIRSMNVYDFVFQYKGLAFIDDDQAHKLRGVIVQENDILLNITGASVARCCMVPSDILPARVNQHVSIIRIDCSKANPKYILFYINSPSYKNYLLGLSASGATREALTKNVIENLKIPLPKIEVQNKISSILSSYDELIENNKQRIKLLEEMAEEIYKEWFVRLRFPGYKETKLVDGLPEGWEITLLKNHITIFRGKSYSSEELRENEGLPMLNLKNINRNGGFRRDGLKYFEGKYSENNVAHLGDIILAVTDMTQNRELVGRVARVPDINIPKFIISMDLVKIESTSLPTNFLYSFFRYSGIGLKLAEFANGANVLHLTPSLINLEKIIVPTLKLVLEFEKIINPFLEEIDILENKNQLLQQTRDLLLPRLISGKLSVEHLVDKEEELIMVAEPGTEYIKA
jgi:type I restriction enzyme S subunit